MSKKTVIFLTIDIKVISNIPFQKRQTYLNNAVHPMKIQITVSDADNTLLEKAARLDQRSKKAQVAVMAVERAKEIIAEHESTEKGGDDEA